MTPTKAAPTDAPTYLREQLAHLIWQYRESVLSGNWIVLADALAAFLTTREAEIRRNALEEAAQIADRVARPSERAAKKNWELHVGGVTAAAVIASTIRTLSQEPSPGAQKMKEEG